ncbi:MAG: amidophosphoribosyltransferase [Clostridiales bacterium]|nr:amidophosphoribosyltransferase [Clostridiales bacterium]
MDDIGETIFKKPAEECAVFGTSLLIGEAAGITCNGLMAQQHRGQEGAGIAVLSGSAITCVKNRGLVSEVFSGDALSQLPPSGISVGHTRYSTTGSNHLKNVQPFVTEYLKGRIATVHNGNVVNATEIRSELKERGVDFSASSDSEVISALIAYEALEAGDIVGGVVGAAKRLRGAFSLIVMNNENKLIAARDPYGFRPLCFGRNEWGRAVASESCALDSTDFAFERDVEPGEVIAFQNGGVIYDEKPLTSASVGLCVFEYVYFARPDSVVDGLSVYEARYNMGARLAAEHPVEADAVCGVPDSGIEASFGYAAASGLPLVSGFVKNRYIGRSFICPTQTARESAVKMKLNPLRANIEGKRIVLVDDSIVRGTTSAKIIAAMRGAGAREVHMRVSSPPFRHACHFGTDIDREENLIANHMSVSEIARKLGADSLGYISEDGLRIACGKCRLPFCMGCFNGRYGVDPKGSNLGKMLMEG